MHFDERDSDSARQRRAARSKCGCRPAGVEDHARGLGRGPPESSRPVRLRGCSAGIRSTARLLRRASRSLLSDLGQGRAAIDFRLPRAKEIEIGPVQDIYRLRGLGLAGPGATSTPVDAVRGFILGCGPYGNLLSEEVP